MCVLSCRVGPSETLTQTANGKLNKLSEVIEYVSAEEAGILQSQDICHENQAAGIGGLKKSGYKRSESQELSLRTCGYCGDKSHGLKNSAKERENKCKAYNKKCSSCGRLHHFSSMCRSKKSASSAATGGDPANEEDPQLVGGYNVGSLTLESHCIDQVPSSPTTAATFLSTLRQATTSPITTLPLPHHVHTVADSWKKCSPTKAPNLPVNVILDRAAYGSLALPPPKLQQRSRSGRTNSQQAVLDTGAQVTVVPQQLLHNLAVHEPSVFPIATAIKAVNAAPVDIMGGIFLRFVAKNFRTGATRETRQLAYISRTVPSIYLSREACVQLGTIPSDFPQVGQFPDSTASPITVTDSEQFQTSDIAAHCAVYGLPKCSNTGVVKDGDTPCSCPTRALPPTDSPALPCPPSPDNLPQLKQYILERFKASAFNCCEQQVLPLMNDSPPLRLHIDPSVKPTAIHTPSAIPRHWVNDVKAGLDRDERLDVIERVPVNEPARWISRMLITAKADGSPRRVIDYQAVNAHTPRQTHHTRNPWAIASSVPAGKYKSVLDNWHGYHSVPLAPEDRDVTCFLTPWGRYRYKTTPQGLNCAGDGYTQRSDIIMEGMTDLDKCIDDTILWSDSIEQNFYKVCEFLTKCSNAGMVFNPAKFQFSEKQVDYLGFTISDQGIRPQDQFLDNIRTFPTPNNITDVRSWFGLINQVSYSFATAPAMAPFRHLLSAKIPFYWSEELQASFDASKEEIIQQCNKGVRSFSLTAPTALATDWSKLATGFWLCQKFCTCPGPNTPGCCKTGWQTVYCGLTFNSPSQARYHPIEGEAYAVKQGLEKCKQFILGHPNLILCVDHKPLLAIMGSQELAEIPNPRLLDFKIKTLAYRFTPKYIPGKLHVTADALSRRSDSPIASQEPPKPCHAPKQTQNNVKPAYSNTFGPPSWVSTPQSPDPSGIEAILTGSVIAHLAAIRQSDEVEALTWDRLEAGCRACPQYRLLHNTVMSGVPENSADWDTVLQPYFRHRHSLSTLGPVVLHYDKPIIPANLRQEVMQHLHAAHGCANMMFSRASSSLYWPKYREDITAYQARCRACRRIAPSNPSLPPTSLPQVPAYPFESVVADFFTVEGRNYLAMADRYSNWLSIMDLPQDKSCYLIQAFRDYAAYFGIPRIISSDGASIFTSAETQEFCRRWGIQQRISSAYHAHSNKRAEVAVKSCKRMVQENLQPDGSLHGDKMARALLIHRNTPDPATGVSPAQIIFGRPLRDHLPTPVHKFRLGEHWQEAAKKREDCLMKRHYAKSESLHDRTKTLPRLIAGDNVYIQDQTGKTPKRWNKSGKVIEVLPHDSYLVRVDGSFRTTKRNRKFLRKFTPFMEVHPKTSPPTTPTLPLADPINNTLYDLQDKILDEEPTPRPFTKETVLAPDQPVQGPHQQQEHHRGQYGTEDVRNNELPTDTEHQDLPPISPEDPPNIKLKLFKTSSGWSASPGPQLPTPVQHEVKETKAVKKPLKERWILTENPQYESKEFEANLQTITAAARAASTILQACLEAFNPSQSSTEGGGITRIQT